jgi:hypothetical protein
MNDSSQNFRLAIVGGGPNCTYALERLSVILKRRTPSLSVDIHVFEKNGLFGAGCVHNPLQPKSNLLNRITGQVAFAPDEHYERAGELLPKDLRPTLHEWAQRKYRESGDKAYDLTPEDWPPRYIHGQALMEQFELYVKLLEAVPGVRVRLHAQEVVAIREAGGRYYLRIDATPDEIVVDHILFATGYSKNRHAPTSLEGRLERKKGFHFIPYPYPLSDIDPDQTTPSHVVGCIGLGQSALDVILYLTQERGGRFVRNPSGRGLRYFPSGKEPKKIVGFSQSGVFANARPYNAKETDIRKLEHKGVFFTEKTIDRLRQTHGVDVPIEGHGAQKQLDFEKHVFPIMHLEMACLYYKVLFGEDFGKTLVEVSRPRFEVFTAEKLPEHGEMQRGIAYLEEPLLKRVHERPHDPEARLFSWEEMVSPIKREAYQDPKTYTEQLLAFMEYDILQCEQNNLRNPSKAAIDGVWRDLRSVLAYAVDFGGLSAASHKRFLEKYVRYHNRLADGGGIEQSEKMIALVRAGILDVGTGPDPEIDTEAHESKVVIRGPLTGSSTPVDTLINGRLCTFNLRAEISPLYRSLLEGGFIEVWKNPGQGGEKDFEPGGLVLTKEHCPIGKDKRVNKKLCFLGAPSEGPMCFQTFLARPGRNHIVLNKIIDWSQRLLFQINEKAKTLSKEIR